MKNNLVLLLFLFCQITFSQQNIEREFRGVWIATKDNIDWPSSKTLSTEEQKKELIELLDLFKNLNFNVIIFQIRPSADAFYNSKYEPWSVYLTGTNDKEPAPYYDPLAFIISETHKRGMEFHAWLNPYRAIVNYQKFQSNPFPLSYEKPEWFINYGANKYFNPGIPEVRKYTNKVVADIVQNYDVDAIHFDDYFYPYKIAKEEFQDGNAFKKFGGKYYPRNVDDWRRNNVNLIIEELYTTIKTIKPWVQFGISPFGVWRNKSVDPKGSDTQAGQTNYDDLYADVTFWLKNKWLDYVLPQDYWHIGFKKADYKKVAGWWADNNYDTNLYMGQAMYRLGNYKSKAWKKQNKTEIEKQIEFNRSVSNIKGSAYFSAKSFLKNPLGINDILKNDYYSDIVLPPSTDHNQKFVPEAVSNVNFTKEKNKIFKLSWDILPENKEKEAIKFLVYQFKSNEMVDFSKQSKIIEITGNKYIELSKRDLKNGNVFQVIAVSRNNNISLPVQYIR